MKMIERKSWEEFKKTGLLWFANMILHTFGWAIVYEYEEFEDGRKNMQVYPARCKFRGFEGKYNTEGYIAVSKYMKENAEVLAEEAKE